jgi:uncharacterized protein (TIGR00369 family)
VGPWAKSRAISSPSLGSARALRSKLSCRRSGRASRTLLRGKLSSSSRSETTTQQHGFLHAGIVATIVDSACGYAALTLMPPDAAVLTAEYKVNLLAPAAGEIFVARASVLKAGRTLTVVRGDAFALNGPRETRRNDARDGDVRSGARHPRLVATAVDAVCRSRSRAKRGRDPFTPSAFDNVRIGSGAQVYMDEPSVVGVNTLLPSTSRAEAAVQKECFIEQPGTCRRVR